MDLLDAVQWPAMAITVAAAYFVAASHAWKRHLGFWLFLVSNVAWVVWGVHTHAYALIALQVCLAAMNIRGAVKASSAVQEDDDTTSPAGGSDGPDDGAGERRPPGRTSASTALSQT